MLMLHLLLFIFYWLTGGEASKAPCYIIKSAENGYSLPFTILPYPENSNAGNRSRSIWAVLRLRCIASRKPRWPVPLICVNAQKTAVTMLSMNA